ncbi:MAG: M24 family metallopeptidase [Phycisphaerae bacterium]
MNPAARPKAYLKARHAQVRQAMQSLNLDGMLLTRATDLSYLTNFSGDSSIGLIKKTAGFTMATDFRYEQQASIEAGWVKLTIRDASMAEALAKMLTEEKVKKVGFEANFMTYGQVDQLKKELVKLGTAGEKVELVPVENVMANIRKVKDDNEVALIRKAVAVAEEAFLALRDVIEPGVTENYLAGLLISELRSRGAQDVSFPPIVAAGTNSALPHYRPGDVIIGRDTPLLFDWGAMVDGYCSDLTRTFVIGRTSSRIRKAYAAVLEAQEAAIAFLRPGVTTMQADTIARDVIQKAGFDKFFGHGLGHGIGRDIHELPTLRKTGGDEELRPGMIVTIEPGIYLPGEGGVRIEDDVLITHSGCEVLTTLPRSFEECHIE